MNTDTKCKPVFSFSGAVAATAARELSGLISKLTPAEKSKITKYLKRQIKEGIDTRVAAAVKVKQDELDYAISVYGGRIAGRKEDIQRVYACIHPDRPNRTEEQLTAAAVAFQRLLEPGV